MRTDEQRRKNRDQMRRRRAVMRMERLLNKGHCPVCTILLKYEVYHKSPYPKMCPFYEKLTLHTKLEANQEKI